MNDQEQTNFAYELTKNNTKQTYSQLELYNKLIDSSPDFKNVTFYKSSQNNKDFFHHYWIHGNLSALVH